MEQKYVALAFLLGASFLFLACSAATPYNCYVSPTGDDVSTYNCSSDKPCKTINYCFVNRSDSDLVITLGAGTFSGDANCNVAVDSSHNTQITSLVIQGFVDGYTEIDCGNQLSHFHFADLNAAFALRDVALKNGVSKGAGGCIFASGVQSLTVRSVWFTNCSASIGGALYANVPATVLNSTFLFNTAQSGGALYLVSSPDAPTGATVSQSIIRGNVAQEGAGLFIFGDYATVTGTNITNNTAYEEGGGLYFRTHNPNSVGKYNFVDTLISNNQAPSGGGLYSDNLNHTFNVFGALFKDNWTGTKEDPNIACSNSSALFCYSCTAKDCNSGCAVGVNQTCSQTPSSKTVNCYSNNIKFKTCKSTDTCTCQAPTGLSKSAKIVIILISVCLFVGVVLIVVDVGRHFMRKRQSGYQPIK